MFAFLLGFCPHPFNCPRTHITRLSSTHTHVCRVYTDNHLCYTAACLIKLYKQRHTIKGLRRVYATKLLSHFTARFEPMDPDQEEEKEQQQQHGDVGYMFAKQGAGALDAAMDAAVAAVKGIFGSNGGSSSNGSSASLADGSSGSSASLADEHLGGDDAAVTVKVMPAQSADAASGGGGGGCAMDKTPPVAADAVAGKGKAAAGAGSTAAGAADQGLDTNRDDRPGDQQQQH